MKVEEAKTKVCPFISSFGYYHDGTLNTGQAVNCICGDCMAWAWSNEFTHEGNVYIRTGKVSATEGYCSRLPQ